MRTASEPRMLLEAIQGATYREMKDADAAVALLVFTILFIQSYQWNF